MPSGAATWTQCAPWAAIQVGLPLRRSAPTYHSSASAPTARPLPPPLQPAHYEAGALREARAPPRESDAPSQWAAGE
eukprot:2958691-Alexandrium_andersonii.AAC.1